MVSVFQFVRSTHSFPVHPFSAPHPYPPLKTENLTVGNGLVHWERMGKQSQPKKANIITLLLYRYYINM